jgi:Zn ribbon nucleic-acid-binding protein
MYVHVGPTGPITCSKCGSLKAVNPVNEPDVSIRCLDCGHERRSREADERDARKLWDQMGLGSVTIPKEPEAKF